jgi:hypothetical protein
MELMLSMSAHQVVKIYREVSTAVEDAIQKEEPQNAGGGTQ